jgi:hypothetical protein
LEFSLSSKKFEQVSCQQNYTAFYTGNKIFKENYKFFSDLNRFFSLHVSSDAISKNKKLTVLDESQQHICVPVCGLLTLMKSMDLLRAVWISLNQDALLQNKRDRCF